MLDALATIAPVTAIRGNNDRDAWARDLPDTATIEVHGTWLYVLHDVHDLDLDPRAAGFAAVISGHSHKPAIAERDGTLFRQPRQRRPAPLHPARGGRPLQVAAKCPRGVIVEV